MNAFDVTPAFTIALDSFRRDMACFRARLRFAFHPGEANSEAVFERDALSAWGSREPGEEGEFIGPREIRAIETLFLGRPIDDV